MIRVVPTEAADEPHVRAQAAHARWFMDYRNADGSVAEMCGNGTRVFAAYLRREGLETADEFAIATRAGVKLVRFEGDLIAVNLGAVAAQRPRRPPRANGFDALVHVAGHDARARRCSLDLGNPHTVVALPEAADLDGLDLTRAPGVNPQPAARHQRRVRPAARRRAHVACGCTSAAWARPARAAPAPRPPPSPPASGPARRADADDWRVDVPGGTPARPGAARPAGRARRSGRAGRRRHHHPRLSAGRFRVAGCRPGRTVPVHGQPPSRTPQDRRRGPGRLRPRRPARCSRARRSASGAPSSGRAATTTTAERRQHAAQGAGDDRQRRRRRLGRP